MSVKIGKASYDRGGKKNYLKFGKNVNEIVARIIPPIGDLADKGKWSMFYRVHFGYKSSDGFMRPFQSPEKKNFKTGMIEVEDAAKLKIQKMEAALAKAKEAGDKATVDRLGDLLDMYNLDSNHYMNVVDRDGRIGILQIRHKCKLALDAEIAKLRAEGVDPLSVEDGRFFVFNRTGTFTDTTFSVRVLKEKIKVDGKTMESDVVHVLDESIIQRLGSEAAELDKLYKAPTAEEVARIVSEGAKAVDEILGTASDEQKSSKSSTTAEAYANKELAEEEPEQEPAQTTTPVAAAATTASVPASAAPTSAVKSATTIKIGTAGGAPTASKSTPKATPGSEPSDEEFLKSIGL